MKIAIVTDSNSGITQEQAKTMGIYVLPMPFMINGETFEQGYEQIVHIPMSSGLSGSCQTARMLAQDEPYEDKVFVVNNQRISVTQRRAAMDAKELAGMYEKIMEKGAR